MLHVNALCVKLSMKMTVDFGKHEFHDASIKNIERRRNTTVLNVESTSVSNEHADLNRDCWKIESA